MAQHHASLEPRAIRETPAHRSAPVPYDCPTRPVSLAAAVTSGNIARPVFTPLGVLERLGLSRSLERYAQDAAVLSGYYDPRRSYNKPKLDAGPAYASYNSLPRNIYTRALYLTTRSLCAAEALRTYIFTSEPG